MAHLLKKIKTRVYPKYLITVNSLSKPNLVTLTTLTLVDGQYELASFASLC